MHFNCSFMQLKETSGPNNIIPLLRVWIGAGWILTIHSTQATMHYLLHIYHSDFSQQDQVAGYSCVCDPGWTSTNCSVNINCLSGPCQNGATCIVSTHFHCMWSILSISFRHEWNPLWSCFMHNLQGDVSDYNCTCVAGWEGQNCDIDTNDCILNPCENGATCNVRRN